MASYVVPSPAAGGGIKSVQRGVSTVAETVTITAVDTAKSFVNTFSDGSSPSSNNFGTSSFNMQNQFTWFYSASAAWGTGFSVAENGAYLSTTTTLVTTGPCRWEVIEFA